MVMSCASLYVTMVQEDYTVPSSLLLGGRGCISSTTFRTSDFTVYRLPDMSLLKSLAVPNTQRSCFVNDVAISNDSKWLVAVGKKNELAHHLSFSYLSTQKGMNGRYGYLTCQVRTS